MNIETVKITANGYIINGGEAFMSSNSKNIQEWIDAGNTPDPQFTDQELLTNAKNAKKKAIDQQRESNKKANIIYTISNTEHEFSRDDLLEFNNAALVMGDNDTQNWPKADGSIISLTKANILGICGAIKARDANENFQAAKRKEAVNAKTTVLAVNNYDITTNINE